VDYSTHARIFEGMAPAKWFALVFPAHSEQDRILTTCDEHGLEYVTDKTNFLPDLTIRNTIRHVLAGNQNVPSERKEEMERVYEGARRLNVDDLRSPAARVRLQAVLEMLGEQRDYVDEQGTCQSFALAEWICIDPGYQVTSHLRRMLIPAPISTVAFRTKCLREITDPIIRTAFLLRILRYVSSRPWGSVRAEAGRNSASLNRLMNELWAPSTASYINGNMDTRKRFSTGSDVMWAPAAINPEGDIRILKNSRKFIDNEEPGWLAVRLRPHAEVLHELTLDVTEQLSQALRFLPSVSGAAYAGHKTLDILWDNRFLIRIDLLRIPPKLRSELLSPSTKYRAVIDVDPDKERDTLFIPRVTFEASDPQDPSLTLARISTVIPSSDGNRIHNNSTASALSHHLTSDCHWISFEFIRSLEAI
jgi:tRNA(Ile)-lysidine synthase